MTSIATMPVRGKPDATLLHAAPSWRTIAIEQIRAVGLLARNACIFLAVATVLLSALTLWAAWDVRTWDASHAPQFKGFPDLSFASEMSTILDAIAFLIPFFVWQDEDPTRRLYHWAMPVSRPLHSIAKVFAGWTWLMAVTLLFEIVITIVASAASAVAAEPRARNVTFASWEWLVPYTATTVAYVLTSAAVVGTRRPLVWIAGVATSFVGVLMILAKLGKQKAFEGLLETVVTGPHGLVTALGRVHFWDPVRRGNFPELASWLGSTTIWLAIGALLLGVVAYRHTEPA